MSKNSRRARRRQIRQNKIAKRFKIIGRNWRDNEYLEKFTLQRNRLDKDHLTNCSCVRCKNPDKTEKGGMLNNIIDRENKNEGLI